MLECKAILILAFVPARIYFRLLTILASLVVGWALWTPQSAWAVTRTWDGGGATNNWSEAANWSGDAVPTSVDTAQFDATSTKPATIDSSFTIDTLNILTGYTGTITQAADLTLEISFIHSTTDGSFGWSSGTLTFNTNTAGTWNVDTDDVFGPVTINKTSGVI